MRTIPRQHQDIRNNSRVQVDGQNWVIGTVIAKGGNAWVTVRLDKGGVEAMHVDRLLVFARPRPVIEAEAKRTDPTHLTKLADLRHEWRLHRPRA